MTTIKTLVRSMRVVVAGGVVVFGPAAVVLAQAPEPAGVKSPAVAQKISVAAIVAPALIFLPTGAGGLALLPGLVLGPTAGYVYAGVGKESIRPAAVRAAVLGGAAGGAAAICAVGDCSLGLFDGESGSELALAVGVLLGGVVATVILAGRDVSRVGARVRVRNEELLDVSVRPTFFPDARSVGIAVAWKY